MNAPFWGDLLQEFCISHPNWMKKRKQKTFQKTLQLTSFDSPPLPKDQLSNYRLKKGFHPTPTAKLHALFCLTRSAESSPLRSLKQRGATGLRASGSAKDSNVEDLLIFQGMTLGPWEGGFWLKKGRVFRWFVGVFFHVGMVGFYERCPKRQSQKVDLSQ